MSNTQPAWWQKSVIYQIYPRSFMDSSGDGVGDLPGIISRLDYLQWLGIGAIWLSPTFPSPMADFGYDVADYQDVHPEFGTLADMDRLIAEARQRGIRILLDLVPNHTSDEHAWFVESRASRDNPKRDWYIWRDAKPDGSPPNNWMSYFGGPAWDWDETTGQYYLHLFHKKQPDLNWRNPEVREAMLNVLRFWLDRGIAGFRVDVIDRMIKDEQFRDNPENPDFKEGDYPIGRHLLIYSESRPEVHDIIKAMRAVANEYSDRVLIGEIGYDLTIEQISSYGAPDELHLPFNFKLINLPWDAAVLRDYVDAYDSALPEHIWPNYVMGNHDMTRIGSRIGAQHRRIAGMLLLTLRGTPFIYYGEEIGMMDVDIPREQWQDPQGVYFGSFSRDLERTPMQWDASKNAGFSEGTPWLPLAPDYAQVNVAVQKADDHSILTLYQHLMRLRRESVALNSGAYRALSDLPADCFAYIREQDGEQVLVALNFADEERTLTLTGGGTGELLLSTLLDREGTVTLTDFTLRPNEGVLIRLAAG